MEEEAQKQLEQEDADMRQEIAKYESEIKSVKTENTQAE
jgi:hypothetical protein